MRIAEPFGPIEVGEIDAFAFDMTKRVGTSQIVSATWSARLTPFAAGSDASPGQRIGATWVATTVEYLAQQRTGWFVFAMIGPMPASAAGSTYVIEATAFLADGRILADNNTVQCVLPGQ